MIKSLHKNDTLTSPYIATKNWQLSNVDNSDLILMEHSGSTVCLEMVEYNQSQSFTGSNCSICSEKQENDLINFREGEKSSGIFFTEQEEINLDGTFKRMVHSQVKEMFYNNYRDPTKMWGLENIDFDKSQTKKFIADLFRLYDVPRKVFGEKILENTVQMTDVTTDNDYVIEDDGHGNLLAGPNLFAKQQEIGIFSNSFSSASASTVCNPYFNITVSLTPPPVSGYSIWVAPESDFFLTASISGGTGSGVPILEKQFRQWSDLSGNNNHMIFTGSMNANAGPFYTGSTLNGKRIVPFGHSIDAYQPNRTGLLSTNTVPLTNGCTVFFVGAYLPAISADENAGVWVGYKNFDLLVRDGLGVPGGTFRRMDTYNNSGGLQLHDSTTLSPNVPYVFAWRFDSILNEQRLYRSGTSVVSGVDTGAVPASGRVAIGFREDDSINSHLSGYYAEMIFYASPLTDAEITLVNSYLTNKYAL